MSALGVITGDLPLDKVAEAKSVEGVADVEAKDGVTPLVPVPTVETAVVETAVVETTVVETTTEPLTPLQKAIEDNDREKLMWRVRGAASHLFRSSAVEIPVDRQESLRAVLKQYFGKDEITEANLNLAANLSAKRRSEFEWPASQA